ncbi:MAG: phosphatidate cytidylyltransferase [Oscillospiraceae bacterium]|jgi:phosphatidate cytidylyltransferase|nr:phosphatidate cytidylyltransferase [Oscillospiraceae bacterium]
MRARVFVGLALLPLLIAVVYLAPPWALPAAVSALSVAAVWELLHATGLVRARRVLIGAAAAAALTPFWCYFDMPPVPGAAGLFLLVLWLFAAALLDRRRAIGVSAITGALFAGLAIPLLLSSLVRIAARPEGSVLILLPFLTASGTDICALFTGMLLGRRKLAPEISPHKTVEGSLGGFFGALALTALFVVVVRAVTPLTPALPAWLLIAGVGSLAAQVGDLSFSLIKREFGLKDFGALLPGHGGVLDRFDSLLFAAPMTELLLALLPLWGGAA